MLTEELKKQKELSAELLDRLIHTVNGFIDSHEIKREVAVSTYCDFMAIMLMLYTKRKAAALKCADECHGFIRDAIENLSNNTPDGEA